MKTIKVKDYYGNYLSIPVDGKFYDEWKDMEREENRLYKRERYHCFPVDPDTFDDLAVSTGADDLIEDLIRTEENHRLYAAISKLTPIQRRRVLMFMDILTRQEYCGDVVNFKTAKHFRDKRNHYVDRSQWHITENVHEPIIDRTDFENVQRILENAPVKRPNGDGEIHPLSGLLFCKDCGAKMHIRIDYRNGGKRHVAYCSEYHKGKAKNPKCSSPHIMDADLLMQTVADVLKKIAEYSISNRAEFEALVKKSLAMQQTDKTKKQQKRIPQITTRLEQIDKVLNKLYEDNALGTIPQDRYEQMSQKYSEEYYSLKAELEQLREQLSAFENAGGRAQKFVKLIDRYADFTDLTPTILNEFISRIEVHERDKKRAKQAIQHIGIF